MQDTTPARFTTNPGTPPATTSSCAATTYLAVTAAAAQPHIEPPSTPVTEAHPATTGPGAGSVRESNALRGVAHEAVKRPQTRPAQAPPPPPKRRRTRDAPLSPRPFWTLSPTIIFRRLITRFDFLHLHALSGTLHLVYGVPRCLWMFYSTAVLHQTVQPWGWELPVVAAVYLVKDVTAVPLTLKHRRGAMRSLFLVAGFLDVANWAVAMYLCPSYTCLPDVPDGAARTVAALLATAAVACGANAVATTTGVVDDARGVAARAAAPDAESPRHRGRVARRTSVVTAATKQSGRRARPAGGSIYDSPTLHIFYAACQIIPAYLLFVPTWGIALGGAEAREWMLDSVPNLETLAFDVISVSNLFGSIGIFAGTLQTRLLISVYTTHALLAVQLAAPLLFVAAQCMTCDAQAYLMLYAPYFLHLPLPWEF